MGHGKVRSQILRESKRAAIKTSSEQDEGATELRNCRMRKLNTVRSNFSACSLIFRGFQENVSNSSMVFASEVLFGSSKKSPVTPSTTVSMAPPARYAITGRPAAFTFSGDLPKS